MNTVTIALNEYLLMVEKNKDFDALEKKIDEALRSLYSINTKDLIKRFDSWQAENTKSNIREAIRRNQF